MHREGKLSGLKVKFTIVQGIRRMLGYGGSGVGRRGDVSQESLGERGLRGALRSLLGSGALKEKVWHVGNRRGEELENADVPSPLLVSSWGLWWRGRECHLFLGRLQEPPYEHPWGQEEAEREREKSRTCTC